MSQRLSFVLAALLPLVTGAFAGEVAVSVSGIQGASGEIACALFSGPKGFPLDLGAAKLQRTPARVGGEACRFRDLKPGTYALAIAQLPVGQKGVAKNFLGQPLDPWGVSQNVRPSLRAPTFGEAAFLVGAQGETRMSVELAK